MKITTCILIFVVFIGGNAPAETIQIELSELLGAYNPEMTYGERATTVALPNIPIEITKVWYCVSGAVTIGEMRCDLGLGWEYSDLPVIHDMSIKDPNSGNWWSGGEQSDESGDFEFQIDLKRFNLYEPPATWDFLKSGIVTVRFMSSPPWILGVCGITEFPETNITSITLLIEGEFQVGTESYSWGAIKAIYSQE